MGGNAGSMVDCPICGEEFDPTGAGGWCTNPECGEWQYEDEEAPEGSTEVATAEDPPSADAGDGDGDGDGRTFPQGWARPDVDGVDDAAATPDTGGTDEPDGDPSEVAAPGATAGDTPEDSGFGELAEMSDDTDGIDPSGRASSEFDGATTGDLVDLGAGELEDTERGPPEDVDAEDSGQAGAVTNEAPVVEGEGDEQESEPELSACPSCGADVDPGDNFCVSCGEDLDAHQGGGVLRECPSCGTDVDPGDNFCVSCGEDLDAHRDGDGGGTAPQSLLLATRDEEIAVTDGDTVGRELRNVVMTTGGDEDQAVRIHREHIRFVREDGQFYMIDLGKNPTRLNGHPLEKGDRRPVSPGDEIELSGVLGLVIREP